MPLDDKPPRFQEDGGALPPRNPPHSAWPNSAWPNSAWYESFVAVLWECPKALWPGKLSVPASAIGQLRLIAQNQIGISIGAVAVYLVFAMCFTGSVEPAITGGWVIMIAGAHMLNRFYAKKFLSLADEDIDASSWDRRFRLSFLFYNSVFASFAFLFWVPDNPTLQSYVVISLAFIAAPITVLTSCYRPAFYASIAPVAIVAISGFTTHHESFGWEFGFLVAGAGGLLLQLANSIDRTMVDYLGLKDDKNALIEELSREKSALEEARQHAETANQTKSRFLAQMSHEVRTPLNAIIGFSEIMAVETFGPHSNGTYKEYSQDIHASGRHLLGLINDILDLSKIEAGGFTLYEEMIDIAAVARDCCHIVALRAEAMRITLAEDFEPDLPPLYADQRAIRQVLLNLLTNAIKFSPPDSTVTVVARRQDTGDLLIGVHDTGPGIDETEIDRVLETFVQGKSGKSHGGKGSGLGLAIVKGLVEIHGGVFVLCSRVGAGTQANAYLPPHRLRGRPQEITAPSAA